MALKCTVERDHFYEGLNSLQNITSKKGTLAILLNVLIETSNDGLILTGTDMEIALRIIIPAKIEEEGTITIPAKKVFEIVRESGPDSITIEEKENSWVHIVTGQSSYNLAGMPGNEFPQFPEYDEDNFVSIESYIFQELIEKTIYSIAGEQESVYTLTSVLLRKEVIDDKTKLKMISSDGHRLTVMEKDIPDSLDNLQPGETTLIPKKGVQEWKKFCDAHDSFEIALEDKKIILKDDNATMIIRLKDGEFPNYKAIIDAVNQTYCMKIRRQPFLESLKRINLFTEDLFHTISFELESDHMILSSQNVELGNARDEMSVEYNGQPLKLGFNCRYFIETLQVMEGEIVNVYVNSDASPCLLNSDEDQGFTSIIMPMHL